MRVSRSPSPRSSPTSWYEPTRFYVARAPTAPTSPKEKRASRAGVLWASGHWRIHTAIASVRVLPPAADPFVVPATGRSVSVLRRPTSTACLFLDFPLSYASAGDRRFTAILASRFCDFRLDFLPFPSFSLGRLPWLWSGRAGLPVRKPVGHEPARLPPRTFLYFA